MKEVIADILEPIPEIQVKFLNGKEFAIKIFDDVMMPLYIELQNWGSYKVFVVAHNYEQNGDLVPDPDMLFLWETSDPIEITQQLGYTRGYKILENGEPIPTKDLADLRNFANIWAENIKIDPYKECVRKGSYKIY